MHSVCTQPTICAVYACCMRVVCAVYTLYTVSRRALQLYAAVPTLLNTLTQTASSGANICRGFSSTTHSCLLLCSVQSTTGRLHCISTEVHGRHSRQCLPAQLQALQSSICDTNTQTKSAAHCLNMRDRHRLQRSGVTMATCHGNSC